MCHKTVILLLHVLHEKNNFCNEINTNFHAWALSREF